MWSDIYDGLVFGRAWDPLEWFPSDTPLSYSATPDPGLGVAGFDRVTIPPNL
jgi:hypothetical protein